MLLGLGIITGAGHEPSAMAAPEGRFDWPLHPRPTVQRQFDKPLDNWLPGHRGVDLAGAEGQAVRAAGAGRVAFAGMVADKPVVSIEHRGGLRTTYEPVRADVPVGRRVEQGTRIGVLESGHPGCSTPCLHWGVRARGGSRRDPGYLDPLGLLRLTPLRLKPVHIEGRPHHRGRGRRAASRADRSARSGRIHNMSVNAFASACRTAARSVRPWASNCRAAESRSSISARTIRSTSSSVNSRGAASATPSPVGLFSSAPAGGPATSTASASSTAPNAERSAEDTVRSRDFMAANNSERIRSRRAGRSEDDSSDMQTT